ncbi:hypothetical protein ACI65C_004351 [Semiaphis heraclei]
MKRFLIPNKLKSNDVTENVSSVLDASKIDFPCTSTTVVESIKPESKQTNSDELFKLNVLDLSSTCDESAVQPVINFPRTVISGKHRCFQSSWYSKYPWLEYSITLNAVFCYYCRHFPPHLTVSQSHTEKDALINRGYSDWKNISNLTKKHENTSSHKNAVMKYNSWLSTKKTGSVSSQINQQVKDQIIKNRETLTSIIRCILYCSRQDIGIREHKKIKPNLTEDTDNPNWACHDVNEGEIIGLLEAVFAFQSVSTLRHHAFFKETNFKIPQHCDTRWVSKYKSIQFFKTHFGSILKVLNTFKESSKKREAAEAKGLILQFAKFEVIVILVCLNEILNIVNCLSINLQSSTLNIGQCTMLIKATKKQILDLREDKNFFELYEQSLIIAQNANVSTPSNNDVSSNRMSQGPSRMTDYYITSTTDVICVEMNKRFDENGEFYAVLGVLDQTSKEFLDCETLCNFAKTFPFYQSDEFLSKLKYQCALGKTLFSSSSGLFELLNQVLAPCSPTYWPSNGNRHPDTLDFFITNLPKHFSAEVVNLNDPASDHTPISLLIGAQPSVKQNRPAITPGSTNWDVFRATVSNKIIFNAKLKSASDATQKKLEGITNQMESQKSWIQKRKFSRILKKTLDKLGENNISSQNLVSGFKASGIFPLDPNKVLQNLPDF